MLGEWIIPIAYLLGWLLTARAVAVRTTDKEAREVLETRQSWRERWREPHRDDGKPLVDNESRAMNVMLGFMLGIFWPLVVIGLVFTRTMTTPTERAEAERLQVEADRQELEKLRRLAREHDLPMPGE